MANTAKTIEQKRSSFAFKCAEEAKGKKFSGKYKSLVKKFPMMVLRNGMLQALAFIESKIEKEKGREKESEHKLLRDHIEEYMRSDTSPLSLSSNGRLSEYLSNKATVEEYRLITQDVLSFMNWLRRYTEAFIEKEE